MKGKTDLTNRIRVYRHLRRRSDIVRTKLIPTAIATVQPARELFQNLTLAHFEGDVQAGQMVSVVDMENADADKDQPEHLETTKEDLASLRNRRCSVAGFEPLHPRYLSGISGRFFAAVDADRVRRRIGELDLDYLSAIGFFLQLGHLAKDGTGRTGEDMLVCFAAEAGRAMTFSPTGYRGALEGPGYPLFYRLAAERILQSEFVGNFFRYLGLAVPRPIPIVITEILDVLNQIGSADGQDRQPWPNGLGGSVSRLYRSVATEPGKDAALFQVNQPYRYYAEFLACEMIYLTLCLEQPVAYLSELKARYPVSFACSQYCFEQALERPYQPIPDEAGDDCDEAVALMESVRMGWSSRGNRSLERAVAGVEAKDTVLGTLFRDELGSFLTEAEREAIQFDIRHGMTGLELQQQIMSGSAAALSGEPG